MLKQDTRIVNLARALALVLGATAASTAFAGGTEAYTGDLPWAEAAADFNGDGMQDLAVVNYYDNDVAVLFNTTGSGSSTLSLAEEQSFGTGSSPEAIAVADFNGDGKPDLVVGNFGTDTVSVLINTTVPGSSIASFETEQEFTVGYGPGSVVVADFNGDGLPDIATTSVDGVVAVLLNTTPNGSLTASFTAYQAFTVGSSPWALAAADINGDGLPDLAVVNLDDNTVSVLLNTTSNGASSASFLAQQVFAAGNQPQSVAAGDIDGDGQLDLVIVGAGDSNVAVLRNTTAASSSTVSFAAQQTFATANSMSYSVALADVNGDGKLDVLVADAGSPRAAVLVNTTTTGAGTMSFAPEQDANSDAGWGVAVLAADLNGDGMPEIALVSAGDSSVVAFLNTTSPGNTSLSFQN